MGARLLCIAREFTLGGAAFLALRHLQRLSLPIHVDFLVTGPVSHEMRARLPGHVNLHETGWSQAFAGLHTLDLREAVLDSRHECLRERYDGVLGTSLFADPAACATYSLCKASSKALCLVDEVLIHPDICDEARAAMRNAIVASDRLVSVSSGLLATLTRGEPSLSGIPCEIIPPPILGRAPDGVPSPYGDGPGNGLPRVVTVARLSFEKQIDLCLRVHRSLRDRGVDFMWHVLGDGTQRAALDRGVRQCGMADRFRLEGLHADPRPWLRHADLSVLLSRSEGCPTVIREALAESTPVLSTDVNGANELIDHQVTGIVVPNSEPAIIEALGSTISDRQSLARMRSAAAALAPHDPRAETRQLLASITCGPRPRPAPLVSVLIPTFNQERLIRRSIQSALMQDFDRLEVVVCDDCSTDGTARIARDQQGDARVRVRINDRNLGRVPNYRKALNADASGSWVMMLDGDDHLSNPSFIRTAMEALATHTDRCPVFVQAGHRVVRQVPQGCTRGSGTPVDIIPDIPGTTAVMSGGEYLKFVYRTGFFTHLGTLYSRAAALRTGFYVRDISSSDMDSLLRLALEGNVVVLRAIAGCWVHHGGNTSSNLPLERIEENVRIFRDIAVQGAAAGKVDMASLERSLTRYEARTLVHLFGCSMNDTTRGFVDALRMMLIMFRVNPRTCLEPELATALRQYAYRLSKRSLRSGKSRLRTLIAARGGSREA